MRLQPVTLIVDLLDRKFIMENEVFTYFSYDAYN